MTVRVTAELSADPDDLNRWSIGGLTNDTMMTLHASLRDTMGTLVEQINEAKFFHEKRYSVIKRYDEDRALQKNKFLTGNVIEGRDPDGLYDATEDLLFLSEELRKVTEVMFRIKTEPGVF